VPTRPGSNSPAVDGDAGKFAKKQAIHSLPLVFIAD